MTGASFRRCRGFALILVLGLLALIASVMVALSALVMQESMVQGLVHAQAQARENARLALLEAFGVLQEQAGPDAVVTARAQMLGKAAGGSGWAAVDEALAWTGVWSADASVASPQPLWLVSGAASSPLSALPPEDSVALVAARKGVAQPLGAATVPAWAAVRVPLVTLPAGAGAYAWWVGDEGVKVNIAAPAADSRRARAWLARQWAQPELDRLESLLPGPDVDALLPPARVATIAGGSGAMAAASATALRTSDAPVASVPLPLDDSALRARMLDLTDIAHLAEGRPDAADAYGSALFHEVTLSSRGVLADPQTGLRADYSLLPESFPIGGEFALYADYMQAMEPPLLQAGSRDVLIPTHNDLRRRYRMRAAPATLANGEVSAAIAPILTDCYLLFNVHRVSQQDVERIPPGDRNRPLPTQLNRVMIHAGLMVELWNPYTSALVPEDLLLEVSGLPTQVRVRPQTAQGTGLPLLTVNIEKDLNNGPLDSWWIELPFTDKEHPGKTPSWLPGRVYNWTGPNNYMQGAGSEQGKGSSVGNFFHRFLQESAWAQLTALNFPSNATHFTFELPAKTKLTLRLRLKQGGPSSWATAPVLAEIRDVEFNRVPVSAPVKADTLMYQFGFRVRLEDPGTAAGSGSTAAWDKSQWLRRADPRTARYSGAAIGTGAPVGQSSYYVPSVDPRDYVQSGGSKGFLGVDDNAELWNRQMGASGRLQLEDAPLFELPRQDLLRVADLRHLHLVGQRPYAIGNRWGAAVAGQDVNRVFDLGFFSGLRPPALAGAGAMAGAPLLLGGEGLPNERLLPLAEYGTLLGAGGDSAAHLLLHGAFNLNTLSPSAWRAVLTGLRGQDFSYIATDHGDGSFNPQHPVRTVALTAAVSRFSQSAAETFDPGDYKRSDFYRSNNSDHHDPAVEPPTAYFRQGVVPLSDAQLDLLAQAVVNRMSARASGGLPPFRSFAEFLGPVPLPGFAHPRESHARMSVLEAAVYDVMSDASLPVRQRLNRDADGNTVWWDAPSFVNGGDLWAQFAHYAAVRSDTFRIRSYGRSADGRAQAWSEAIVQRLPEPFAWGQSGGGDPAALASAELRSPQSSFGRRFKVVSVRWLREEEL